MEDAQNVASQESDDSAGPNNHNEKDSDESQRMDTVDESDADEPRNNRNLKPLSRSKQLFR